MLSKVLIANRGEIAVRVIRACQELGIASVAVYSDLDRDALHVRLADEAYALGGQTAAESYLNTEKILEVIERSRRRRRAPRLRVLLGEHRLRPGHHRAGRHLHRSAARGHRGHGRQGLEPHRRPGGRRATACPAPPSSSPSATRSWPSARSTAGRWPSRPPTAAAGAACGSSSRPTRPHAALESAQSEALKGFGRDECYVERYLTWPRHVEMQIVGDSHGNCVWVGERDCSAQRRHQKLIEEAPAPDFPAEIRQAMGEAAVKVAKACGYVNAGTVEFLYQDGEFFFLEMNTRLQVEHPVTELVSGHRPGRRADPRGLRRAAVASPRTTSSCGGHAIEVRINAEDPAGGRFLPSPGRITKLVRPARASASAGTAATRPATRSASTTTTSSASSSCGATTAPRPSPACCGPSREFRIEGVATTIPADLAILEPPRLRAPPSTPPSGSRTRSTSPASASEPAAPPAADGEEPEAKVRRDVDVEVNGKRFAVAMWVPESRCRRGRRAAGGGAVRPPPQAAPPARAAAAAGVGRGHRADAGHDREGRWWRWATRSRPARRSACSRR